MPSAILRELGNVVSDRKLTIACVESATAGRLTAELSLLASSGQVLRGGIVCYKGDLKEKLFGIPKETLERFTPESAEVTEALVSKLPDIIPADIHIAVTGLTGPGGSESDEKPVGTIFVAILYKGNVHRFRQAFSGSPEQIVLQTIDFTAKWLLEILLG